MKRTTPNMQMQLLESEKRIREQAAQIIEAKENGIHQQSIEKMICWLSLSKSYYDTMKRRYKENGE